MLNSAGRRRLPEVSAHELVKEPGDRERRKQSQRRFREKCSRRMISIAWTGNPPQARVLSSKAFPARLATRFLQMLQSTSAAPSPADEYRAGRHHALLDIGSSSAEFRRSHRSRDTNSVVRRHARTLTQIKVQTDVHSPEDRSTNVV
jgi:hypothetical protein